MIDFARKVVVVPVFSAIAMTTLLLVPTNHEFDLLSSHLTTEFARADLVAEICGFGPVASAVMATRLIAEHQPDRVILAGISGSLTADLPLGTAQQFRRIAMYGVGVGSGREFRTAEEMGWAHLPSSPQIDAIGDIIDTCPAVTEQRGAQPGLLVTSCAASACKSDAELRRQKFPDAIAEDMEAFSVAMACLVSGVPFEVIRGISNIAGDRDKQNWRIPQALAAAAEVVKERLR